MKTPEVETEQTVDMTVLANQIDAISNSLNKLLKSGLTQKAIVILVQADTGISRTDITSVLESLKVLSSRYTTFTPTKK